jgi:hypothetical protein
MKHKVLFVTLFVSFISVLGVMAVAAQGATSLAPNIAPLDVLESGEAYGYFPAETISPTIGTISPYTWITSTKSPTIFASVIDTGTGLNVASAQYRYSINGGAAWSGYFSATVTGVNGVTSMQTMTATAVPFNQDSGTQNKIELRIADMAGNVATAQSAIKIDTTPPTNPTSILGAVHTPSVWSNLNTIGIGWSGASDGTGSGISGYSFLWNTSSTTLPPTSVLNNVTFAISPPQPDSNHIYFHIRTRDAAGNWASTAAHLGPFYIDTTPPQSNMSLPATVNNTLFLVTWSATDAGSGVASYDVQYLDETAGGSWKTWKTATPWSDDAFSGKSGHIYEFRVRAHDKVGNVESYRPGYDTRTAVTTADFSVKNPGVEIDQSVQDLNNSVLLIANKRTFVRCYVLSEGGTYAGVSARLRVYRNSVLIGTVNPSNTNGHVTVKASPDRSKLSDSFYFDVPKNWLFGSMSFECEVNAPRKYAESNYSNNTGSAAGFFQPAPTMQLVIYDVPYLYNNVTRHVRDVDRTRLAQWLKAAYPINQLQVWWDTLPTFGFLPTSDQVNTTLMIFKMMNYSYGENLYMRYYGMVFHLDQYTFMRGAALDIPSVVASGPTGAPSTWFKAAWDGDASYGDWYGGHELGHTYGLYHSEFCGAVAHDDNGNYPSDYVPYPYPNGRISPSTSQWSASALYGIDWSVAPRLVITPTWTDIMTYCPNEWMSALAYTKIWTKMWIESPSLARQPTIGTTASEHLMVVGKINITPTDVNTLYTFYRLPDTYDFPGRDISGTYSIRLFDAGNALLANYPFSPHVDTDSPDGGSDGLISEIVPWITGTQRIAIWHNSTALITRTVSTHVPTGTLLSPNGGQTLSGSQTNITWTASDADNDPLTYSVDYSRNGGITWKTLAIGITQTQFALDLTQLPGTTQGKFRVWASDGVNTAFDASDSTFTVTGKLPRIVSILPASGTDYVVSQTVALESAAIDVEDGTLYDYQYKWASNLQGSVGTGQTLQTANLIIGTHLITLTVTDTDNNVVTATTTININPEPTIIAEVYLPLILR